MEKLEEWIYGIAKTEKGTVVSFYARSVKKHNIIKKYDNNGSKIIEYYYSFFNSSKCAQSASEEVFSKYSMPKRDIDIKEIQSGSIAEHIDDGTTHQAIILDVDGMTVLALFLTSNPLWNPYCRKITKEEAALIGFYGSVSITYVAPVIRDVENFVVTNFVLFPEHRLKNLRKEFPWTVADLG